MEQIKVRFEEDPGLDRIDVIIRAAERDAQVEDLVERILQSSRMTLTVTDESGSSLKLEFGDIICLSVEGKKTYIITADRRYHIMQPLQSVENLLGEEAFVRISRYEIINLAKVRKYEFTLGGMLRIELENGMETWASRRCIPLIRKRLSGKG